MPRKLPRRTYLHIWMKASIGFIIFLLPSFKVDARKKKKKKKKKKGTASSKSCSDDPTAKALNYVSSAEQADKKLKVTRMGIPGNQQFCKNCSFYTAGPETKEATCTLITSGCLVKADGWCSSWVKKTAKPS